MPEWADEQRSYELACISLMWDCDSLVSVHAWEEGATAAGTPPFFASRSPRDFWTQILVTSRLVER